MSETVAIYGGTFSPPHNGHVRAAEAFLAAADPDRLLIIPTAIPPHKTPVLGATAEDRLAMCRLAFASLPRTEVSEIELRREGKSYTVDTLRALAAADRRLAILMGTDMFLTLDHWYRAEEIFALADIYVMRRRGDGGDEILKRSEEYHARYAARVYYIDTDPIALSSTELRMRLEAGASVEGDVPLPVLEYIRKCKLYRK